MSAVTSVLVTVKLLSCRGTVTASSSSLRAGVALPRPYARIPVFKPHAAVGITPFPSVVSSMQKHYAKMHAHLEVNTASTSVVSELDYLCLFHFEGTLSVCPLISIVI
jgi:hypothetical protein